jgi:hypothetical protein
MVTMIRITIDMMSMIGVYTLETARWGCASVFRDAIPERAFAARTYRQNGGVMTPLSVASVTHVSEFVTENEEATRRITQEVGGDFL